MNSPMIAHRIIAALRQGNRDIPQLSEILRAPPSSVRQSMLKLESDHLVRRLPVKRIARRRCGRVPIPWELVA